MQHESFMSWGQRMAQELGASFKIIGRRGVFAPLNEGISASGKMLTPITGASGANLLDWDITPVRGRPQFGHAVERHYDIASAQWNEVRHAIDNLGVDMDFRAPLGTANAENAAQRAKAAGKGVERAAGDGSATILGDPAAEPEAKFILTGARPGIDGEYTIDSLTHSLDKSSGFTTSLQLVRPSAGAGRDSRDVGAPASAPTRNGIAVVGGGFGGPTA
jgi:phage protein D